MAQDTSDLPPAYETTPIPPNLPTEEYDTAQRRRDLLERIREAGHPNRLHQTKLAGTYDVDPSCISRDLDELSSYVADTLGDDRDLEAHAVFSRAIRGLLDEEKWFKAVQAMEKYQSFLDRRQTVKQLRNDVEELRELAGVAVDDRPGTAQSRRASNAAAADADPLADVPVVELTVAPTEGPDSDEDGEHTGGG